MYGRGGQCVRPVVTRGAGKRSTFMAVAAPASVRNRLVVQNLTKDFGGLRAVDGVSFALNKGEILGLIGPNGSGKTTTINLITGLLNITGGSVVVAGTDVTGMRPAQRREHISSTMAMIFQDALTALNPTMRIGDQVAEVPRQRLGMSRSAARARASWISGVTVGACLSSASRSCGSSAVMLDNQEN